MIWLIICYVNKDFTRLGLLTRDCEITRTILSRCKYKNKISNLQEIWKIYFQEFFSKPNECVFLYFPL